MLQLRTITIDCADWSRLVQFWHQAAGWTEDPDDPNQPGDPAGKLVTPDGLNILFIPVPEPKTTKNRVHLDLGPADRTRDEEVTRLLSLGARLADDQRRPDGSGWVVLADPEGNEFCLERSEAELKAAEPANG
jgi:hypothetical protein